MNLKAVVELLYVYIIADDVQVDTAAMANSSHACPHGPSGACGEILLICQPQSREVGWKRF